MKGCTRRRWMAAPVITAARTTDVTLNAMREPFEDEPTVDITLADISARSG
jgi:hypothetical protein